VDAFDDDYVLKKWYSNCYQQISFQIDRIAIYPAYMTHGTTMPNPSHVTIMGGVMYAPTVDAIALIVAPADGKPCAAAIAGVHAAAAVKPAASATAITNSFDSP
jgi:hypothetical protein